MDVYKEENEDKMTKNMAFIQLAFDGNGMQELIIVWSKFCYERLFPKLLPVENNGLFWSYIYSTISIGLVLKQAAVRPQFSFFLFLFFFLYIWGQWWKVTN